MTPLFFGWQDRDDQRLRKARATGRVPIHCCAVKGKGYAPAETSADTYHGVTKFTVATGQQANKLPNALSYTKVFDQTLTAPAEGDPKIVCISATTPSESGIDILAKRFPDRTFDIGLVEQRAVTFADARFAKPLDTDLIRRMVRNHRAVVTAGRGAQGGFGAMVLRYLANEGPLHEAQSCTIAPPDRFIDQAAPDAMYADAGMTGTDIAAMACEAAGIDLRKVSAPAEQAPWQSRPGPLDTSQLWNV